RHRPKDVHRERLVLVALGGAGRHHVLGELPNERLHLPLFVGQIEVHTGANPSRSPIEPVRSSDGTARTRAPMSASPSSRWSRTVSAPSSWTSANAAGGSSGSPPTPSC